MTKLSLMLGILSCTALAGCVANTAPVPAAPTAPAPAWSIVKAADGSQAGEHGEGSFAHTQGKLVLIGGRRLPATDVFDLASCSWSKGAPAPFQLHHFQAVGVEGEIYVLGAFTNNYPREDPVAHVMIYNVAGDSWRQGAEIPADRRRGAAASVLVGEWIYIIGGAQIGHVGGHVAWTDRFNIRTGAWERLPDAPRARDHTAAALANGKIVLGGGRLSMAPENTFQLTIPEVDVFDPATGIWTTAANPLPTPRAGVAAAEFRGAAYFLGGESAAQDVAHREVEGHGPAVGPITGPGNGIRSLPDMPQGSHGFGAASIEEAGHTAIYTTGGVITRGGGPPWSDLARFGVGAGPCGAS